MKIAFFDTHGFERPVFAEENDDFGHEITHFEVRLSEQTASLAAGFPVVCAFVNDRLGASVLEKLASGGTRLIALRCAGFNNVDLEAAAKWGIRVARVPEYSPHAVAEHAVALILSLDRKIHRAHARVREGNFSLEGLVGFDLHGKTVGVVGTGRIGAVFAKIMLGFGCRVLAYDRAQNEELAGLPGLRYVELPELLRESQIISLHVPLTPSTRHLIDGHAIDRMRPGVMIINTGRGALIDTQALVRGLKSGRIGSAGLDVYEEEEGVFFEDLSNQVLQDDTLARLLTFPNVLMTSHQAFLTTEALSNIARTTLKNVTDFQSRVPLENEVTAAANLRKSGS
jgi:D-lactate dehydrogenase